MVRTQISLTEEQKRLLDELAASSGLSLSELVRRAVERSYGPARDVDRDLARLRSGFGAWAGTSRGEREPGKRYVERLRSGARRAGS